MSCKSSSTIIDALLRHDEAWCSFMGYFNPYLDPFEHHLRGDVPVYDGGCYERYKDQRFIYDKLWVAKSQGLHAGLVSRLLDDPHTVSYPIFVKPRWGHKTSGSKYCQKITSAGDLPSKTAAERHELMWSELLKGREGMTDFIVVKGQVVYEMSHECSNEQHGFADAWKYTAPRNKAPTAVREWVEQHLRAFTGIVNVQYRDDKVFEAGLRPARTGAYFAATDNEALLRNVSTAIGKGEWNFEEQGQMTYKPFYSFKCHTRAPIVYLWPQHLLDAIMRRLTTRPFYEYYPEPTGSQGMVFLQFMHDNLEEGKKASAFLETLFTCTQWFFLLLATVTAATLAADWKYKWALLALAVALYLTQLLNPLNAPIRFTRARRAQAFT